MGEIHLLSEETIDKIAAGEVVERPLNVVKELVENSVDAGANAVSVEIKEGGIAFIRVTDNGTGIPGDQIRTAFFRHATSKINDAKDLNYITSLGFRGEALSSIAAVSQVEIVTKTSEALTGFRYTIEGGKEGNIEEIGAPTGTTIMVRNLFFNTPPRKKFLRLPQTEGGYIADMMEHLALCRPDISFQLIVNGNTRFHTSGNGNLKEVIYRIYGKEISESVVEVSAEKKGMKLTGYMGKPALNRSNRNFETVFVNSRYVQSQFLYRSIEEGSKEYLMQHKFPFCVLSFELPPEEVDVNVHPSKLDIRFINREDVFLFISSAISAAYKVQEMIPEVVLTTPKKENPFVPKAPEPFEVKRVEALKPAPSVAESAGVRPVSYRESVIINKILGPSKDELNASSAPVGIIKANDAVVVEKNVQMELFEDRVLSVDARGEYEIIGQIFDTYWIVAFRDKVFFIDQHAAHEKVKYERLMRDYRNKKVASQMLNPPVVVNLTMTEENILKDYMPYFEQLGFEIEEFGGSSYALRSVPTDLYGCDEAELFKEVMDELVSTGGLSAKGEPAVICAKIASMSCKAAVKGNNRLSLEEINTLIDELLTLDNPYNCPHGRPTIFSMSKYEIEKKFKRVVE